MRKALIIGLNDYPSAPLHGCVNDAHSVASILRSHSDGSPNFDVKLVTDTCSKSDLKKSIRNLFEGENDIALLYFSGHGIVTSTGGYIATTDYEEDNEGVSMDDILLYANGSKAKNKVIMLDCCHSGAFGSPAISNKDGLASICEGLTVLTASRKDEAALEVGGSGLFTSLLVEALHGGGADLIGDITPGSVYSYIDRTLGAWDQRPIFKTNVSTFTSLRKVNPPIPLETLRKISDYFSSPEEQFKLDPSFEPDSESPNEDNVEIFGCLQKMVRVGLVTPVDEEHMYYAAMNSKACRLTAMGYHYWKLATAKKI
ncbi:caspase family protein [Bacillus sp. (in: firmicutes)]|uniref:caspase family protein n=1 Tax=Bacillus sp. TaxID=1409 RepID=UPI002905326B|nr:caspase family protein [Bacillus sp. (in: firmicutes)]MDU2391253.1 caspase family protein [Bacillus sp. (in: firmicutes)]